MLHNTDLKIVQCSFEKRGKLTITFKSPRSKKNIFYLSYMNAYINIIFYFGPYYWEPFPDNCIHFVRFFVLYFFNTWWNRQQDTFELSENRNIKKIDKKSCSGCQDRFIKNLSGAGFQWCRNAKQICKNIIIYHNSKAL